MIMLAAETTNTSSTRHFKMGDCDDLWTAFVDVSLFILLQCRCYDEVGC